MDRQRDRREAQLRMKARLEPYAHIVNRIQATLLWTDLPARVTFLVICVVVHIILGQAYKLMHNLPLISVLSLVGALFVVLRFALTVAPIPWGSIFSVGHSGQATGAHMYSLEEVANILVDLQSAPFIIKAELDRMKSINISKYTAQMAVFLLSVAWVTSHIPGYWVVWIIVFASLFAPGVVAHGDFNKLVASSGPLRPHLERGLTFAGRKPITPITVTSTTTTHGPTHTTIPTTTTTTTVATPVNPMSLTSTTTVPTTATTPASNVPVIATTASDAAILKKVA
eukprot:TRINITY_DN4174_c0_g1_i2.p1 TRINITY_DN4174_c0_g1~~TRINITY_DN4174_c0_g1_i2.p1  ORF type:complete len:284 (-),score=46.17 TRINITY_DN4174_c0_g1_i2:30-881(-)